MAKKLSKKQLKAAKGGNSGHVYKGGQIIVPTIDAPIAPDPHVVVVVTGTTKTKASKPVKGKISGVIL